MDVKNDLELEAVKEAITHAREWAKKHFRAKHAAGATLLSAPAFKVEFPDVDRMTVIPWMYNRACGPTIQYRLRINHKTGIVSWHPTELLYGIRKLPDLFPTMTI